REGRRKGRRRQRRAQVRAPCAVPGPLWMPRPERAVLLLRGSPSMKSGGWRVVVSAEHAGNRVPAEYRALFRGREALLASHRGWDPGTATLAAALAHRLGAALFLADVTRLVVDLNRSPSHPGVFSEITRALSDAR